MAHLRLRVAGIPLPTVLITAADVHNGKPSPEGYLQAARRLGKPAAECVVVEDAAAGIAAATAARMRVVAVAGTAPAPALARADFRIHRLADLHVTVAPDGLQLTFDGV